jgi:hypothetical protein
VNGYIPVSTLPIESAATQKLDVGHETDVSPYSAMLPGSMLVGLLHAVPS